MAVPYTNKIVFTAPSGEPTAVAISAPGRGILTRLIVKQTTGTLDGFDVDLYDSLTGVSSLSSSTGDVDDECHRVCFTDTADPATDISERHAIVAPYINQDPRDDTDRPTTALYLEVTPLGSGTKTFHASWTITVEPIT